ncbi:MAG: hypothetical protein ACLP8S_30000 [Solirubrobacteraceae bacterium]
MSKITNGLSSGTRGWRARRCPTCKAPPGEACRTPSGREASRTHAARLAPGRHELHGEAVWAELARLGATIAAVPFRGRAGRGGQIGTIVVSRLDGDERVDVAQCTLSDELAHALQAPVWERFGTFAGQPLIVGTVTWRTAERRVLIKGTRGSELFEEAL